MIFTFSREQTFSFSPEEIENMLMKYLNASIANITDDGYLCEWEVVDYHNDEWAWVKTNVKASPKQIALKKAYEILKGEIGDQHNRE